MSWSWRRLFLLQAGLSASCLCSLTPLSPSPQFELLRAEVALEHLSRAAATYEWSPAAKDRLLLHLANTIEQILRAGTLELWRVKKGARELRCITKYLPTPLIPGCSKAMTFSARTSVAMRRLWRSL